MTDKQTIVIYHNRCQDGFCAAYVAWLKYGDTAEYVPANYGDPPPDVRGKDVLIVDFSYPRAVLERMHAEAKSLRVLDHHRTAEADLAGLPYCTFDTNRSGAGLAWDELCSEEGRFDRPKLVSYVEDRDLWRFALEESRTVNAFISSFNHTWNDWDALNSIIEHDFMAAVAGGRAVCNFIERYVSKMREEARMLLVRGHTVPVVNAPYLNTSELVGALAEGHPFAVGWYQAGDGKFRYSLRSRGDFDVSEIAKSYGGGGHKNAAGFVSAQAPDSLFGARQ